MARSPDTPMSRRERQIMDILYQKGQASVNEVLDSLGDPPSYNAVRGLLRVMEEKGQVTHIEDGPRYLYRPVHARASAARSALRQVVQTFFGGDAVQAAATLLSTSESSLRDEDLARLESLIQEASERKPS